MYSYEIDEGRALMTFWGDLDNSQIRQALEEVMRDPSSQPSSQILVNDLETGYDPSVDEAQELAEMFASFGASISQLAVVVHKEFHFGLGRMVEVFCESQGVSFRIFRTLDDARAWLDEDKT